MKALRLKILAWIWIFGIFFDMMTTIIGVGIIGTRELNPIGFNWYLIGLLIFSMIFIFASIKYYDRFEFIRYDLSRKSTYKVFIILLTIACVMRWIVVLNNILMMYITHNYTLMFFPK